MSSFDTYYPITMQKHPLTLAVAGFWHILKLAVGYYLLCHLLLPSASGPERWLLLWFGSPALMAASLFFFPYFRPGQYGACLGPARLTLGFDAAVAFVVGAYALVELWTGGNSGLAPINDLNVAVYCAGFAIVDCLFLLALPRAKPTGGQED